MREYIVSPAEQLAREADVFPGITLNPDVRFGRPCISGTRIDVATIVGALAAGDTAEVVAEYSALKVQQVREALRFAGHLAGLPSRPAQPVS